MLNESIIALAVGAHPDDIEINCAGTLKLLRDLGADVHVATMTLGDCGSNTTTAQETRRVRRREAEEAAALLGAKYYYCGSNDFSIFNDDAHNQRVTELVREVGPSIVFTHPPVDYMSDHECTSTLVRNACFYASAPNYVTSGNAGCFARSIPHLYYYAPMEGIDIFGKNVVQEMFVDVGGVIEFKLKMLGCHASQREWLREQHGIDEYLDSTRRWTQVNGELASAAAGRSIPFAEGMRQHRGHSYPRENLLEKLLPNSVVLNGNY